MAINIKISILIPVYNVEKYIERCARSLMEQTVKTGIEFIFINDGSADKSIDILENVISDYKDRKDQVRIIHQPSNMGLSNARLRGLKEAKGKYVINCDSDDWVETDMYENLLRVAEAKDADIVVSDFYHEFPDKQIIEHYETKSNIDAILSKSGNYWWCTVNRLVKKSLYLENNIYPIPNINMLEDVCVMMRLYFFAKKIEYVPKALYHYDRTRDSSLMHQAYSTEKLLERKRCIDFLSEFFKQHCFDFNEIYNLYKINIRDSFLLQSPPNWAEWVNCYPETWQIIWKDKKSSLIYKLCYTFASWGVLWPFKLLLKAAK